MRETDPSSPTCGYSLSAIWSLPPASWAIAETCSDGRSKRAGWSLSNTSTTRLMAPSRTRQERSRTTNAVTTTEAARQLENVRRLRPLLRAGPWLDADLALRCADISLDLGDVAGALELAQVAGDALQGYPDAGTLPSRLQRLEARIRRGQHYGLTPAELRLVAFLPTHLSLQDIADRLYLVTPYRQDTRRLDLRQARRHRPIRRRRGHRAGRPRIDRSQGHDARPRSRLASRCRVAVG